MEGHVPKCDFCSLQLDEQSWEFPARSFDYPEHRVGPGVPVGKVIGGSLGSWMACVHCKLLIRRGDRSKLAKRSFERFMRIHPEWAALGAEGVAEVRSNIRTSHDLFWRNREGTGTPVTRELLDRLAAEPPFEERPV